ncbi:deoxyribose-phosphate aldolase [Patescibacteria group bacterium]|nr:deoxyribose-phosphate aldolase [Patescibacteria group bacterium]
MIPDKLLKYEIGKIKKKIESLGIPSFKCKAVIKKKEPKVITKPLDLADYIEHTALKPQTSHQDILDLCNQAREYQFRGVCVNPLYIEEAKEHLKGTDCLIVTVIGFPLGMNLTDTKVNEAENAIRLGANEIDMVMAVGLLKSGDYKGVFEDIQKVVILAKTIPVKVILETSLLEREEKIAACLLTKRAGAAFVKTSTGFSSGGATIEDVKLIRAIVGNEMGVKAAGGIRDYNTARAMIEAGADRLGCSSSVKIVNEEKKSGTAKNNNYEAVLKYTWDWFSYHANQRMVALRFFIIIMGAIGYIFILGISKPNFLLILIFGLLCIGIAKLFWIIDVRNRELVQCARDVLDKLEEKMGWVEDDIAVRRKDRGRKCLDECVEYDLLSKRLKDRYTRKNKKLCITYSYMFSRAYYYVIIMGYIISIIGAILLAIQLYKSKILINISNYLQYISHLISK